MRNGYSFWSTDRCVLCALDLSAYSNNAYVMHLHIHHYPVPFKRNKRKYR
jgi:hypothetical protein